MYKLVINISGKYQMLFKNTIIFAIGSIGSKFITFLLVPLYTNLLTTAEYGTIDLIITVSNLMIPFVSLVIQDAVLRFGVGKGAKRSNILLNALIIFGSGSILTIIITPIFSYHDTLSGYRWYLSTIVIINMLTTILFTYLKVKEKNKLYSILNIIYTFLLAILNIFLLLFLELGVIGFLLSNIIAHIVMIVILVIASDLVKDLEKSKFDKNLLMDMVKYSTPLIFNNVSWWILNSSDKFMLERFRSTSELGLYSLASKIPALLSIFSSIFTQAWSISSIKEFDYDNDNNFYSLVFKYYSILMFMVTSFILLIIKPFMSVYVGESFYIAWRYAPFLVVGISYYAMSSFFGSLYGAAKKNISVALSTFAAAIINIIINLVWLPSNGIIVASISTLVSYFVIAMWRMYGANKIVPIEINYIKFATNGILVLIQSIFVTLDIYIYSNSLVILFIIFVVNIRDILSICKLLTRRLIK